MSSSKDEKKAFLKAATILIDTREQQNKHILTALDAMHVHYEQHKLDFGDYSFTADGRDFSLSCVVERKGCINELWGNITKERERFEKELQTARNIAGGCMLLIEGCGSWNELRNYVVPEMEMLQRGRKVSEIGDTICSTLESWRSRNRYALDVVFSADKSQSAKLILNQFFWYWRNYKHQTAPRR